MSETSTDPRNKLQDDPRNVGIMIDIETLSLEQNAYILSIGAARFNYNEFGDGGEHFYQNIYVQDKHQPYFHCDSKTLRWWLDQDEDARDRLSKPEPQELTHVLCRFSEWMQTVPHMHVWSRGMFDMRVLSYAYLVLELPFPIDLHLWRDQKTFSMLSDGAYASAAQRSRFTPHDALADARYQLRVVQDVMHQQQAAGAASGG